MAVREGLPEEAATELRLEEQKPFFQAGFLGWGGSMAWLLFICSDCSIETGQGTWTQVG